MDTIVALAQIAALLYAAGLALLAVVLACLPVADRVKLRAGRRQRIAAPVTS